MTNINNANSMNKLIEVDNPKSQNMFRIIKGICFAFISTLILLLIFSILLTYTKISENVTPAVIAFITAISIFVGSFLSVMHIKKSGLLNGGIIGFIYILLIYLLSSILTTGFSLNLMSIVMIVVSILAGMLGGIVGVNVKK